MPRNTSVTVTANWTQLTDDNVTSITFQVIGTQPIAIAGTNGTTPPIAAAPGPIYNPNQGEAARTLADLFPGVSGANRVWARSLGQETGVFVSHA